jgi:TPR repeat protein
MCGCATPNASTTPATSPSVESLRKEAERSCGEAQRDLEVCYELAFSDAVSPLTATAPSASDDVLIPIFRRAAEKGNAFAQWNLGIRYETGIGVEKDPREAAKWYRKAAEKGYAKAQFSLGVCYAYGKGVDRDEREAVKWLRKAAEQGYAPAQYHLGKCYSNGVGVEQDRSEAVKWWRKAADQGFSGATGALAMLAPPATQPRP